MSFRSVGLKYQDITVRTIKSVGPKKSFALSFAAKCENSAPDIAKKKPA